MDYKLEICANSVMSCVEAQKGGAYRVELCAAIPEGGTTPSYGEIAVAQELLDIKLNVIIRPRGGDFLYSGLEHKIMLKDIEICHKLGVDGIVIGCLTAEGDVDMQRCRELVAAAGEMDITFHRAFDKCRDPFISLEDIISLGCSRILTSGQQPKAEQGIGLLKKLVQQAGDRIIIMPGSGINENNIVKIARETGAVEFHLSAREAVESKMKFKNPAVSMGGANITINEFEQLITSAQKVKETWTILNTK
ncbi:MAG TPA: copper homeostasis protein CutC [Petrimonas sp.]|uniref:copper homeostasis protein CutC n=1 Tax=Petrimonas sp. TaxID=2023866 RepID=UPI00095A92AD|nr:copper homeostasis protein CutC [Petrimonas sp.]OJV37133.1 MAG: copper homeostasis protein CutC [Bacteroidia bacterium 43-41]MEA4948862.1 copper homeostasis protein CutC [Petrimonas sp.]MEA4980263.1 copper homeostasis protein CutC [Petrimonas sp.]MEA5063487.1 copper homeostasis protein CutC [Petrimonas sp.]